CVVLKHSGECGSRKWFHAMGILELKRSRACWPNQTRSLGANLNQSGMDFSATKSFFTFRLIWWILMILLVLPHYGSATGLRVLVRPNLHLSFLSYTFARSVLRTFPRLQIEI